jgi:hypothetical protein
VTDFRQSEFEFTSFDGQAQIAIKESGELLFIRVYEVAELERKFL